MSKLKDRSYRPGRSPSWVKVKNRKHPAFSRVLDQFGCVRGGGGWREWDDQGVDLSNGDMHRSRGAAPERASCSARSSLSAMVNS